MKIQENAVILRAFFGEHERHNGKPLYKQIVLKAMELKLAGATVTKGLMGFGADSHLHTSSILRLSENLPIIVEIIDSKENIEKLLPFLDKTIDDGLITMEEINIIKYRIQK